MFGKRLTYEVRRSIDAATFTGSYQKIGTPLLHPSCLIKLVNNSNVLIDVSIDGTNDHDVAPQNSFWLYDVTSDSPTTTDPIFIEQGRQYWVKGAAGVGFVYLVVQYVIQS